MKNCICTVIVSGTHGWMNTMYKYAHMSLAVALINVPKMNAYEVTTGGWWHPRTRAHDHPAVYQTKDGWSVLRPACVYEVVCSVSACICMSEIQKCVWAPCKKGRLCLVCMKDEYPLEQTR